MASQHIVGVHVAMFTDAEVLSSAAFIEFRRHLDAPMMCFGRRFYKASRMMSFAKNDAYDLRNCCVKLRNDAYCSSNSVVSTSDVVN